MLQRCHVIVTDSGGIQEEAAFLGKPTLVIRTATERTDAVEAGTVRFIGIEQEPIEQQLALLLDDTQAYTAMAKSSLAYGDGTASQRIAESMCRWLQTR